MKNKKTVIADSGKKSKRLELEKILKKESKLCSKESMKVLKEFEVFEFDELKI